MEIDEINPFLFEQMVEKGSTKSIRGKIDTLLDARGEKWADVYNDVGWHKSFASKVHNGHTLPPKWQRIALAKRLEIDSAVLWEEVHIVSADKIKGEKGESFSSPPSANNKKEQEVNDEGV